MNIRRTLTLALAAAALVTSFTSLAQQPAGPADKVWRVGFLAADKRPASIDAHFHGAFARGMRELGYVEGKNLTIEYRYAENRPELLDVLAAELVKMKVDVIVVQGSPPTCWQQIDLSGFIANELSAFCDLAVLRRKV